MLLVLLICCLWQPRSLLRRPDPRRRSRLEPPAIADSIAADTVPTIAGPDETPAGKPAWFAVTGISGTASAAFLPTALLDTDPSRVVAGNALFWVAAPGEYVLTAIVVDWDAKRFTPLSKQVTVTGDKPNPPVPPTPDPTPVPGERWVVIVSETKDRTPQEAATLATLRRWLTDQKIQWRIIDPTTEAEWMRAARGQAQGGGGQGNCTTPARRRPTTTITPTTHHHPHPDTAMENCDSDRIHKRIDALEAVLGAKLDRAGEAMSRQAAAMARQAGVCEGCQEQLRQHHRELYGNGRSGLVADRRAAHNADSRPGRPGETRDQSRAGEHRGRDYRRRFSHRGGAGSSQWEIAGGRRNATMTRKTIIYKGLSIRDPAPYGEAGLAWQNNFVTIADTLGHATRLSRHGSRRLGDRHRHPGATPPTLRYVVGSIRMRLFLPGRKGCAGTSGTRGSPLITRRCANARGWLGVRPGGWTVDVQGYSAELGAIAGLTPIDGNVIVGDGSTWVAESGATARASLGLGSMATQAAGDVAITGGAITGITDLPWPTAVLVRATRRGRGEIWGLRLRSWIGRHPGILVRLHPPLVSSPRFSPASIPFSATRLASSSTPPAPRPSTATARTSSPIAGWSTPARWLRWPAKTSRWCTDTTARMRIWCISRMCGAGRRGRRQIAMGLGCGRLSALEHRHGLRGRGVLRALQQHRQRVRRPWRSRTLQQPRCRILRHRLRRPPIQHRRQLHRLRFAGRAI
jgi:hypothetical protein